MFHILQDLGYLGEVKPLRSIYLRTCLHVIDIGPCNGTMLGLAQELDPRVTPNCECADGGVQKALQGRNNLGLFVAQLSIPL